MRSLLKFAAVLVPTVVVGCTSADDATQSTTPSGDAVEASYEQLDSQLPRRDLAVRGARTGADGTQHIRFDQLFHGIPVFEGEVITHVRPNGNVDKTDALRAIRPNLDTTPKITLGEAIVAARNGASTATLEILVSKLMVLPRGDHDPNDRLAWYVRLSSLDGGDAAQWDTFVDAHTGRIVLVFDSLTTGQAPTHGRTAWSGQVDLEADLTGETYSLVDASGNTTCDLNNKTSGPCPTVATTNTETLSESLGDTDADGIEEFHDVVYGVFGNYSKTLTPRDTAGADAHFGMQASLDYYATVLGRNGIDGNGRIAKNRVHYGAGYQNAFWSDSCFCMTYGDGGSTLHTLTTLDVAGHELSHGVMYTEANLTYRAESGGLNESNSDIFGTMIEFHAAEQRTAAGLEVVDVPDWKIGERLYKSDPNKSLRHMDNPKLDGKSPACWTTKIKGLDVHYSSGPNNHMFYLLANGGTSACNGAVVGGIGREKAAKIWYGAVANWMTASTTYPAARVAAVNSATELYGVDSAEVAAVKAAYSAIKVN